MSVVDVVFALAGLGILLAFAAVIVSVIGLARSRRGLRVSDGLNRLWFWLIIGEVAAFAAAAAVFVWG